MADVQGHPRITRTKGGAPGSAYTPVGLDVVGKANGPHRASDINVDIAGPLFQVCTVDGTPGTWAIVSPFVPFGSFLFQTQANFGTTVYGWNTWGNSATGEQAAPTSQNYTNDTNVRSVSPIAGTAKHFYAKCSSAPGAGQSFTFTFLKNGAAVITLTISGTATSASDDTTAVAIAPGDDVGLAITLTAAAAASDLKCGIAIQSSTFS